MISFDLDPCSQLLPVKDKVYQQLMYFTDYDDDEVSLRAVDGLGRYTHFATPSLNFCTLTSELLHSELCILLAYVEPVSEYCITSNYV